MDEIINQKCKDLGIDPMILTSAEREQLKKEIKAEQEGLTVMDGVLSNTQLYLRKL